MTAPAPDPRFRARRAALVILTWSFFGILGGVGAFAQYMMQIYVRNQVTTLPELTVFFIYVGRFVRSPIGTVICALAAIGASALILRGSVDSRLKVLTIATVVATIFVNGLFAFAVYMPWFKLQQYLSN